MSIKTFDEKKPCPVALKLYKMMEEFETYIRNNEEMIPNYGERWRCGETISSSFVESTVNQELKQKFQQWYSGLKLTQEKNLSFINAA